jgi:hypothetical protein
MNNLEFFDTCERELKLLKSNVTRGKCHAQGQIGILRRIARESSETKPDQERAAALAEEMEQAIAFKPSWLGSSAQT